MDKPNQEIRDLIKASEINYYELLEYIPSPHKGKPFSHVQRLFEELSKPLNEERRKVYLLAIDKVIQKRKLYEE